MSVSLMISFTDTLTARIVGERSINFLVDAVIYLEEDDIEEVKLQSINCLVIPFPRNSGLALFFYFMRFRYRVMNIVNGILRGT
jgi:hypothetical protein